MTSTDGYPISVAPNTLANAQVAPFRDRQRLTGQLRFTNMRCGPLRQEQGKAV
jgi:hypothetical protein